MSAWVFSLFGVLAFASNDRDFATCAAYLDRIADGAVVSLVTRLVPAHLRVHFAQTERILDLGDGYFVTSGDFAEAGRVTPERLRRTDFAGFDQLEPLRSGEFVAERTHPLPSGPVAGDALDRLRAGDVVRDRGAYFVLRRRTRRGRPGWAFEAFRFARFPNVGDSPDTLATLTPREFELVGHAVVSRRARVLVLDTERAARTHLVPRPAPPAVMPRQIWSGRFW